MIVGLCDRFHKLPSEILEEGADLIRKLKIVQYSQRESEGGDYDS